MIFVCVCECVVQCRTHIQMRSSSVARVVDNKLAPALSNTKYHQQRLTQKHTHTQKCCHTPSFSPRSRYFQLLRRLFLLIFVNIFLYARVRALLFTHCKMSKTIHAVIMNNFQADQQHNTSYRIQYK